MVDPDDITAFANNTVAALVDVNLSNSPMLGITLAVFPENLTEVFEDMCLPLQTTLRGLIGNQWKVHAGVFETDNNAHKLHLMLFNKT
jgi:hypothetical protein